LKSEIICSLIAAFALGTGRVWALPPPTSKNGEASKSQTDSITLTFPKDKSLGKLFKVTVLNNVVTPGEQILRQARGEVRVPTETKLRLEVSYYGALDASPLLQLPGQSIVSIDCRHLDNLTDAAVSQIAKMPGLLQLWLNDTDITDKSLESISHLKGLTDLQVSETRITSKGLVRVAGLTSLWKLCLAVCRVGDSALPSLIALKDLRYLQLARTGISDNGLKAIGKLSKLDTLDVAMNQEVTDAGIAELVALQNLVSLEASDTGITLGCLPYLKKMKSLRTLHINDCRITGIELDKIKHELPNCSVSMSTTPRIDPSLFGPLH
jgi:Leucine Rich repeat